MGSTRDEKKAELKTRLIEAAEAEIISEGLSGLKARAVTARAGCALGALYNAVEDLDMLVLHVNSRTIARLGAALQEVAPAEAEDPRAALQALAARYAEFAVAERPLWLALFEHRLGAGREVPEWHRQEHAVLLEVILPHLARLRPDLDRAALGLRARTTFAAVHGVVHLALQGRFVGVPMADLQSEIAGLVETLTAGADHLAVRG
ncbi:TetR family transcriptional regulator [Rhodobacter aestuarii]|uniref:Transcriptional regulator, TetR family n=1 Tax=Rhodobacter aestuarii TaxID=453582 RepID=A0A1N7IUP6_9RHOB|nr:TetR/AcrR family transcriptional regulator [Rhodobacter aestuarii]PTV97509.1 TetR family transcriptional regulator [Rhodobacter aestuarii]SIS40813.1 transcriptional regulator, TetR family [Rhodobacter aestuarii]